MDTGKLVVYKSNQVIEAGYKLSLNEQRIVLACIGQVNSKEKLLKTDEFELSAKNFAKLFGVSDKTAYEALIEVTDSLFNRYMVINNPFPHKPNITHLKTRWISSIYYAENEGKITLCFAEKILPYLSQLEGTFTKYEIEHIGNMTSIYAIRLYELLMQWKSKGKREIEISWLRKQFEIENLYPAMCDFKKRVIDPAVKDINEHSNFSVQWEQRKTGRAVTHLIFTFAEKNPPEPEQTPAATTPTEPPKAAIKLTAEQQACFNWAKKQEFWQKITSNKAAFLTCYNKPNSAIKAQYEAQAGISKPDVTPEEAEIKAKNARKLEITTLRNAIKQLENLNKLSPNSAIAKQIEQLKQQLEEKMKS